MRYLLSWNRFVCRLSMWGCVPFWVEADSLPNWVCGDVFAFEWKQIRFLIEKWGCVSFWVEAIRYCLRLRRCVNFWVETDSFADWVCGDALPSELIQFRLLIDMWGCVPFWEESNTFTVWDWEYALPSELKQIRLQIEYVGMRSLLSRSRFVSWLRSGNALAFE